MADPRPAAASGTAPRGPTMIVSVVFIPTWPTWLTMIGAARRSSERSSVRYPDRVIEPWKKTESRSVCQWVPHLGNRGAGSFIEWRRNCLVRRKGSRVSESQGGGRRGAARVLDDDRSEERRVGKEGGRTG